MEIKYFCPHWGSKHLDFDDCLSKVKNAGYDGVEMSLPLDKNEREATVQLIKKYRLLHIAQHWETTKGNFQEHRKEYRERLLDLASAHPLFINSQTGKDFFSFEQNAELIRLASEVSLGSDGIGFVEILNAGSSSPRSRQLRWGCRPSNRIGRFR